MFTGRGICTMNDETEMQDVYERMVPEAVAYRDICPRCGGTGKLRDVLLRPKDCWNCKGEGKVRK